MNLRSPMALLAAVCLLSTGCDRDAAIHSNDLPPIPADSFRLTVEPVITDQDMVVSRLKIDVLHNATISVDGAHQSHRMVNLATSPADAPCTGQVVLAGSRFSRPGDDSAYIQTYIHLESAGASAGGPGLTPVPVTNTLASYFSISATSGDYKLGTPIEIGRVDGQPLTMLVAPPVK